MIHYNSVKSYEEQKENGSVMAWRKRVFDMFARFSKASFTDREIMDLSYVTDPNLIRPEISRMIEDGLLVEVGKTRCTKTNKTVRHCAYSGKEYFSRGNKKSVAA